MLRNGDGMMLRNSEHVVLSGTETWRCISMQDLVFLKRGVNILFQRH